MFIYNDITKSPLRATLLKENSKPLGPPKIELGEKPSIYHLNYWAAFAF